MSFNDYKKHIKNHLGAIKKIIILGGEPTLHNDLPKMIIHNNHLGLKTTIYTNGNNLDLFKNVDLSKTSKQINLFLINAVATKIRSVS